MKNKHLIDTSNNNIIHVIPLLFLACFSFSAFSEKAPEIQLATKYQSTDNISEYFISEKLDGIRGFWDGTQLLTRRGNSINAPKWFTKNWPKNVMEGELWFGRQQFEQTSSCVLTKVAGDCWQQMHFMLFDLPKHSGAFYQRVAAMNKLVETSDSKYLAVIKQYNLSNEQQLYQKLNEIVVLGGEGLMLHFKAALYQQGRSHNILKLKKYQDAEAKVIGHLAGKGKYQGMLGSILVETEQGIQFKIGSGFSDKERRLPPSIGATITFKYLGKSKKGTPKFASFIRVKPDKLLN